MQPGVAQVGLANLRGQLLCVPIPFGEKFSMMWSQNLPESLLTVIFCPSTVLTAAICEELLQKVMEA